MVSIDPANIPAPLLPHYRAAAVRIEGERLWLDEGSTEYRTAVIARRDLLANNPELFPEAQRAAPKPRRPARDRLDRSTWPRIARWLAKGERPGDAGVGDVVARMVGNVVTEETWNKWHKRVTGKPCKCASSKAALNRLFPFERTA